MSDSGERFSVFLSDTLNNMGYTETMISYRKLIYKEMAKPELQGPSDIIFAGSKGEGVTPILESDADCMCVVRGTTCTENITQYQNARHLTVFQIERENTAPGYAMLSLYHRYTSLFSPFIVFEDSFTLSENGRTYLESKHFGYYQVKNRRTRINILEKQGPSYPASQEHIPIDMVFSLRCDCPSIMTCWLTRPRNSDWPSPAVIEEISRLDAPVVPVGFKGSSNQHLEWRICYTLAELALIHSFNDTQTKVYILLKHFAKNVLKPVSDAITSYVMKNIILWVSEKTHLRLFTKSKLVDRYIQSLKLLAKFIERNYVMNYMMPERHCFNGKYMSFRVENWFTKSEVDSCKLYSCHVLHSATGIGVAGSILQIRSCDSFCTNHGQYDGYI